MLPAGTEVICPACDTAFTVEFTIHEREVIECDNCNTDLELVQGDLKVLEEDIFDDDDEEEDEDDNRVPIAHVRPTEPDDEGRK